jgi:hypothetical protein
MWKVETRMQGGHAMKRFIIIPLLATAALAAPSPAAAASRPALGLGLGVVDPEDRDATLWSTINLRFPLGRRLIIEPEVGFWKNGEDFPGGEISEQDLNLGLNLLVDLGGDDLTFWVGAGVGAHFFETEVEVGDVEVDSETDTEFGLHLLGGIDYVLDGYLGLFAAVRYDIVEIDQAKVYGGLRVRF